MGWASGCPLTRRFRRRRRSASLTARCSSGSSCALSRCVSGCLAERAEGYEGDALGPLLDRVRFLLPELASVGADQGFAAERVWEDAAERGIIAYIPPQKTMLPRDGRAPRTNAQRLAL